MKVLISGAGLSGNALAFWLSKIGHEVLVIERFPSLRSTGLQLDLRGHGIQVLKHMGLEEAFRARSQVENGVRVVNSAGHSKAYFPANRSGKGLQDFSTDWEIMRGDFCRLLYEASKDKTTFKFGVWIERFEQKENRVHVQFSNGDTDTFDLLVGADGVASRTRRMMGLDGFHSCDGQYIAYMGLPRSKVNVEIDTVNVYMAPGGRGIMTRGSDPKKAQVYLSCKSRSEQLQNAPRNSKEEQDAFIDVMRGAGWRTDQIIKNIDAADDFYCERIGLVKLESWSSGRVALVGDAGYCPSANTGMGTTSAIVGAYVLAGEISEHEGDLDEALKQYERIFKPHMQTVQTGVLEGGGWSTPDTSFGIAVVNGIMGLAAFFGINVFGRFILREDVKGWQLPEYKRLLRS